MDLAILFFQMFGAFFFVFLACECGEQVRHAYNEIECELHQLSWYRLPIELRKILPKVLLYAQEPVIIRGFGSFASSREVFRKASLRKK